MANKIVRKSKVSKAAAKPKMVNTKRKIVCPDKVSRTLYTMRCPDTGRMLKYVKKMRMVNGVKKMVTQKIE